MYRLMLTWRFLNIKITTSYVERSEIESVEMFQSLHIPEISQEEDHYNSEEEDQDNSEESHENSENEHDTSDHNLNLGSPKMVYSLCPEEFTSSSILEEHRIKTHCAFSNFTVNSEYTEDSNWENNFIEEDKNDIVVKMKDEVVFDELKINLLLRLDDMDLTVLLLVSTRVGQLVRGMRSHQGRLGILATSLAQEWKQIAMNFKPTEEQSKQYKITTEKPKDDLTISWEVSYRTTDKTTEETTD
jgi:hypothetical protein